MIQTKKIVQALKQVMKSKGITYAKIAQELELSEATIKRSLSEEESLTLSRLESMCKIAGVSFAELVHFSSLERDSKIKQLTLEQEEALTLDIRLFKIFYLLLRQWSLAQIENLFKVPKMELEKVLLQLDKLGLIEFHAGGKVKYLTSKNIKWLKNGPIYKMFESEMKSDFLSRDFSKANEKFVLLSGPISLETQMILKEKMTRLEKEIEDLIEIDFSLEKTITESTAIMLAIGPVSLSIFKQG